VLVNDAREIAPILADGGTPLSAAEFLTKLESLGIAHASFEHEPVFTVEQSKRTRGNLDGTHVKNLFLRNKKGVMWLVTCLEDRVVDLKWLAEKLDAGRFSFASPERLMKYLGVIPGAVTTFAAVNDNTGSVRVALDSALLDSSRINLHPLTNAMTTTIGSADLLRFLEAVAHPPTLIEFEDRR
jgi:Ala-tRNA(Pro) deacylase